MNINKGLSLLLVEDETQIRKYLRHFLGHQGYQIFEATTAAEAQQKIMAHRPDLILLDLGLADKDGQDVICDWREWLKTPIIVLSARGQDGDKVKALENGADDYLTKPFSDGELLARIKVCFRRILPHTEAESLVFEQGGLRIDFSSRSVTLDAEEVRLTPIEYKLLGLLVRHAGKILTYSQILKDIWGRHGLDNTAHLRIHTQHLREKLKDDALAPRFIITEPGIGYRFKAA